MDRIIFSLSFEGRQADDHEIDLYDVARAMMGFQRSLALTTHLVLNNQIITQAPFLKGAFINALPAEEGSWKMLVSLSMLGTGIYNLGTLPNDSPLGHIVFSAYDYVVSQAIGAHVDYNKSLGQLYAETNRSEKFDIPVIESYRFDSVIEKCEAAIREIHRPITGRETASSAIISARIGSTERRISEPLTRETFDFIDHAYRAPGVGSYYGSVSSYNKNTFKGRVFLPTEGRPIPFELFGSARMGSSVTLVVASLAASVVSENPGAEAFVYFSAQRILSKNGRLKALEIMQISIGPLE